MTHGASHANVQFAGDSRTPTRDHLLFNEFVIYNPSSWRDAFEIQIIDAVPLAGVDRLPLLP